MIHKFDFPIVASLSALTLAAGGGFCSSARAITLNSSFGEWSNLTCKNDLSLNSFPCPEQTLQFFTEGKNNQVRFGTPAFNGDKSGLGFEGAPTQNFEVGQDFLLGILRHYNHGIRAPYATSADLTINLDMAEFSAPASFSFTIGIDETPNQGKPIAYPQSTGIGTCKYPSLPNTQEPTPCPDLVFLKSTYPNNEAVDYQGQKYTLDWSGFSHSPKSLQLIPGLTEEVAKNIAPIYVFGRLVSTENPTPTVDFELPVNKNIFEGDLFDFSAPFPEKNNNVGFFWDMDNDGLFDDFAGSKGKWIYKQDGKHSIGLRTFDGQNEKISLFDLTVLNAAPTITQLTGNLQIETDEPFNFFAEATDPGVLDVLTFDWDFNGDGLFDDFTGQSGQWSFEKPGIFDVGLRVSDGDGGETFGSFRVNAIGANSIPEPSTVLGVVALGMFGFFGKRRKSQRL